MQVLYKTTEWRFLACNVAELNYFPPDATKVDIDGRQWYYGFTRRHSQLSFKLPHVKLSPAQPFTIRAAEVNYSLCLVELLNVY